MLKLLSERIHLMRRSDACFALGFAVNGSAAVESFGEGTIGNNGLIVKSRVVGLVDASITEVCLRADLRKGGRLDVAATQKQQCPTQPSTNLIESGVLRW